MSKKKPSIAVHIQSEVQVFSLLPLLERLKSDGGYDLQIVVDEFTTDTSGFKDVAASATELLKSSGFFPKSIDSFPDTVFDIYLTPYIDGVIKARYFLKYEYGTLNIKPNLTYIPEVMEKYHGFLCQSTTTSNLLSAYGKTFPVDNLRFFGKKRKSPKREKPQILFAPTYNDDDSVEEIAEAIKTLKPHFRIIVKGHHGTQFLKSNQDKKKTLESLADAYYGSETSLSDLILESDVCIFGNSSAIAEAIYVNVPCLIFAHNLDLFKLYDIHTTQFKLVESGYLPRCSNPKNILKTVQETLSPRVKAKQQQLADVLFPKEYHTGIEGYLSAIEFFLHSPDAEDYSRLHDRILDSYKKTIAEKDQSNAELNQIISRQQLLLDNYEKGKLYKLATKLYKIEGKIIHGNKG